MDNLASHLEPSPLIHSYGYDYDGHPALALRARFAHATAPGKFFRGRSSNLVVRLIHEAHPYGACAKNLSTRFFNQLALKSKSFMQYVG